MSPILNPCLRITIAIDVSGEKSNVMVVTLVGGVQLSSYPASIRTTPLRIRKFGAPLRGGGLIITIRRNGYQSHEGTFASIQPGPMLQQNMTSAFDVSHISDIDSPQRSGNSTSAVKAQRVQHAKDVDGEVPEFCGPSSSEYTLNVVSGNLKAKGVSEAILQNSHSDPTASFESSVLGRHGPLAKMISLDPLWEFTMDNAISLVHDWCDGVGLLYPIVSRADMFRTANKVFETLESAKKGGLRSKSISLAELLFHDETSQLKMVLAIGRTLACGGRNEQAQRLYQSISEVIEGLCLSHPDIGGIQLLTLVVCQAASYS